MAPPKRTPDRFDEIEIGDTVTYFVLEFQRVEDVFVCFNPKPEKPPYGEYRQQTITMRRPEGFYRSDKIVGGDMETGFRVAASPLDTDHVVTRRNFWSLRKAKGKGKTGENRFNSDDSIVTCQVCARKWIGNSGHLPHHGYERPGFGEQTASCPGALRVAYSVDRDPKQQVKRIGRDVLPGVIANYDLRIQLQDEFLARIIAGISPLPSAWAEFDPRRVPFDDPRRNPILPGDSEYRERQRILRAETEGKLNALRGTRQWLQERYDTWQPGGGAEIAPIDARVAAATAS